MTRRLVPFPVEVDGAEYTLGVFGYVCSNCDELLGLDQDKVHIGLVLP